MPDRVVSVIDVGSNSVRLLVARRLTDSAFEVVDEERFDARLGEGQADGMLAPGAIERGLHALRVMSQVSASYAPSATVVVGTEALRRAPNAGEFIAAAERETGLRVRILTAREEAYASFVGVANSTLLRDGAIIDLGGGSLELMQVRDRGLAEVRSAPLGAIYATERFLKSDPPAPDEVEALRAAVREHLAPAEPAPVLHGVGGSIRNLARVVRNRRGAGLRRLHGLQLERDDLRELSARLATVGTEGRRRIPGVRAERAGVLHAAAVVVDEVMEVTGARSLVVSGQGLREGLAWQELRGESPLVPDVRGAAITGLVLVSGIDPAATRPVEAAAVQLFEATAALHRLGPAELELLVAAARLGGIGRRIGPYDADRHAQYAVQAGALYGFSHREVVLLGALVRAAEGGNPDLPSLEGGAPGDRERAAVLAALLMTARAIRRRAPSPVAGFRSAMAGEGLSLVLDGPVALEAEVLALERARPALEAALGVRVTISGSEPAGQGGSGVG